MRPQDFLSGKLENAEFRVRIPRELVTTQESVNDFAIGFANWCLKSGVYHQFIRTQKINKELLEIYKKEQNGK